MLFVVTPIIIICIITLNILFLSVENEIVELNMDILNQSNETIDTNLRNLRAIAYQLSKSNNVTTLLNTDFDKTSDETYHISLISKEMNTYSIYTNIFDNIALYYPDKDLIITQNFKYTTKNYFESYLYQEDVSFEKWIDAIHSIGIQEFMPILNVEREKNNLDILFYMQPLYNDNSIIFLTLISSDIFQESFKKTIENPRGYFIALDLNNNIVVQPKEIPFEINPSIFPKNEPFKFNFVINNKQYVGLQATSNVLGLRYIYFLSQNMITEGLNSVKIGFLVICLLILLFALIIAYFNIKKKYSPIQSILNKMKNKGQKGSDFNEILNLNAFFENLLNENTSLGDRLNEQKTIVNNRFLLRLVWNSYSITESELLELNKKFDLSFPYDYFCAVEINIINPGQLKHNDGDIKVVEFAVVNITNELMEQSGIKFYLIPAARENISYIINFDKTTDKILNLFSSISETLYNLLSIEVIVALGNTVNRLQDFSASYEEAINAQVYAIKNNRTGLIFYEDVKDLIVTDTIYYPVDKEMALIQNVKVGNIQTTDKILNDLHEINFVKRKLPGEAIKYLIFSMISTIIKIMHEISINNDTLESEYIKIYQEVTQSSDYHKSFFALKEVIINLCSSINDDKKNYSIQDKFIDYIEENYVDKELSLDKMARELHYSYNYMSNIFKEQIGYKFTDYLKKIRIEKALKLLEETSHSITTIADMVGYMSSSTFIKHFKAYYNITPGEYKKNVIKND